MKKVLLVDDESVVLDLLKTLIKVEGRDYQVLVAKDAVSALELFRRDPSDLVMIDLRLPGMNGLDLLREMRKVKPGVKAILMTAYSDEELTARAKSSDVDGFLAKPFQDMNQVMALIDAGLMDSEPSGSSM